VPQPPSENPVRRNARVGPLVLPAEGRAKEPPAWPLYGPSTLAERQIWAELWATPQAVAWERLGWTRIVARYARCVLAAEELNKDAMAEARQLEDRLGLTPKAMRLLLWTIASDEVAEKRQETSAGARGRIKAVG
jgi:cation diffusion facilitator CzcD-associated flavoprotein CzcO